MPLSCHAIGPFLSFIELSDLVLLVVGLLVVLVTGSAQGGKKHSPVVEPQTRNKEIE
jgi:hypothetical protein